MELQASNPAADSVSNQDELNAQVNMSEFKIGSTTPNHKASTIHQSNTLPAPIVDSVLGNHLPSRQFTPEIESLPSNSPNFEESKSQLVDSRLIDLPTPESHELQTSITNSVTSTLVSKGESPEPKLEPLPSPPPKVNQSAPIESQAKVAQSEDTKRLERVLGAFLNKLNQQSKNIESLMAWQKQSSEAGYFKEISNAIETLLNTFNREQVEKLEILKRESAESFGLVRCIQMNLAAKANSDELLPKLQSVIQQIAAISSLSSLLQQQNESHSNLFLTELSKLKSEVASVKQQSQEILLQLPTLEALTKQVQACSQRVQNQSSVLECQSTRMEVYQEAIGRFHDELSSQSRQINQLSEITIVHSQQLGTVHQVVCDKVGQITDLLETTRSMLVQLAEKQNSLGKLEADLQQRQIDLDRSSKSLALAEKRNNDEAQNIARQNQLLEAKAAKLQELSTLENRLFSQDRSPLLCKLKDHGVDPITFLNHEPKSIFLFGAVSRFDSYLRVCRADDNNEMVGRFLEVVSQLGEALLAYADTEKLQDQSIEAWRKAVQDLTQNWFTIVLPRVGQPFDLSIVRTVKQGPIRTVRGWAVLSKRNQVTSLKADVS